MFESIRKRMAVNRAIREAIDTYPGGLCFAAADGRPILANKRLNDLCAQLTGHTITNAEHMWRELRAGRLEEPSDGLQTGFSASPNSAQERFLCGLPDRTVWQFSRRELTTCRIPVIQYEAADVTELYRYRDRLRENNIREEKVHERQRDLLRSIVQNNLDKEILEAKIRIHDEFGRVLLMSRSALTEDSTAPETDRLFAAWGNVIGDMENAAFPRTTGETSPEKELARVAGMIGCRVQFVGRQPSERKPLLLLYAAVREALTNAVRHAGADCLTVDISDIGNFYHAEIRSNGRKSSAPIREGGGLGNLRRRLEQEGARMQIDNSDGVALILTIPKE